jgi:RNA polymerase sigma-70 factor (ECF subfamily)
MIRPLAGALANDTTLDPGLIRGLRSGDEAAFRRLIELEATIVLRTCFRILGSIDDAEDAAQEAFVIAHRAMGSFRGDGSPRAWLLRIATRESWRMAAAQRRRRTLDAAPDPALLPRAAIPQDPAHLVLDEERRVLIRRSVEALPEPYREVISLRYFGELSIADIAIVTGRPTGTIKAQLHRGTERLRRDLVEVAP